VKLLYVHSRKASFVAIDREILAERFEVEDLYQPGRWPDRKSTRLNSSHMPKSRMPSSA